MTIQAAKNLVHHIANQLQIVLGFLELGDLVKSKKALTETFVQLRKLRSALDSLQETAAEVEQQALAAAKEADAALKRVTEAKKKADEAALKARNVKARIDDLKD